MSGLKQQIEKIFSNVTACASSEYVLVSLVACHNEDCKMFWNVRKIRDDVLALVVDYIYIPRKPLEEMIRNRPQTAIVDFAKHGDLEEVEKEVSAILQWFEKLDLLLEESK